MSETSALKILIVDDSFIARQLIANVMRDLEVAEIQVESDGQAGWQAIEQAQAAAKPFDVVFLDWNMPVIEGIAVLKHFRQLPEYDPTAFVMITAASEQREMLAGIKAGVTAYIPKPVSAETVKKRFQEVLDWRKKQRA